MSDNLVSDLAGEVARLTDALTAANERIRGLEDNVELLATEHACKEYDIILEREVSDKLEKALQIVMDADEDEVRSATVRNTIFDAIAEVAAIRKGNQ